jgi:hypothetical protein
VIATVLTSPLVQRIASVFHWMASLMFKSPTDMNQTIGPIDLLVLQTNNRLLKPKHHVNSQQVRATLEELARLLDASVGNKGIDNLDVYSVINCIRLMARTPSDCFELHG